MLNSTSTDGQTPQKNFDVDALVEMIKPFELTPEKNYTNKSNENLNICNEKKNDQIEEYEQIFDFDNLLIEQNQKPINKNLKKSSSSFF